ncbi:MAG: GIY-YIG nuclease family protein [Saprospiraceae bacterium]|nr:GIY-YIG nuclease family protein [Saprospiraceae bacterium]
MSAERYAIIDIETTGGRADLHKITEIAIILHDGVQILDTYETLINPESYIPYGITELTGITQEMVQGAPKFFEVARKIVEMTEGAVFVAHNAPFDYGFVREEFARLGYTFSRKQLCTVRLSRKAFPGLRSYGLDNLISVMGIEVKNRHRAMGDALATAELFRRIMAQNGGPEHALSMVKMGLKEARLPENFGLDRLMALPEGCGVYYFHDERGDVLYVGKSQNIRKRIAEHFADKTEKTRKLRDMTHDITCELTGSELVALLLESFEIKRLRPSVNRAQRQQNFPFVIHAHTDEAGYLSFTAEKTTIPQRKNLNILSEHPALPAARSRLEWATEQFELCRRLSGLQSGKGACFHYHLQRCRGACAGKEDAESYNERARQAMEALQTGFEEDFILLDRGRTPEERAVILVEKGNFAGYGYWDSTEGGGTAQLIEAVRPMQGNPETTRIILGYLHRRPVGLRKITWESGWDSR